MKSFLFWKWEKLLWTWIIYAAPIYLLIRCGCHFYKIIMILKKYILPIPLARSSSYIYNFKKMIRIITKSKVSLYKFSIFNSNLIKKSAIKEKRLNCNETRLWWWVRGFHKTYNSEWKTKINNQIHQIQHNQKQSQRIKKLFLIWPKLTLKNIQKKRIVNKINQK